MRSLSIDKAVETSPLPTEAEMARMEDFLKVAGDGECELRQLYDAETPLSGQDAAKA